MGGFCLRISASEAMLVQQESADQCLKQVGLNLNKPMQEPATKKPGFNLVRWIMVVTLGCSLGLLYVFTILSTRTLNRDTDDFAPVQVFSQPEAPLKLSAEKLQHELTRVIEAQLAAFRHDDYPLAYTYACAPMRAKVSLPAFEHMVRRGYPLLAHSQSAQFGMVLDNGEAAVANVTITGMSGEVRHFQYLLQHELSGWKIFGVTEVKPAGTIV
jgi:hypothetical protein